MTNLLEESNVHLKTQSISSSVPLAAVPALSRPGHIDVHSYMQYLVRQPRSRILSGRYRQPPLTVAAVSDGHTCIVTTALNSSKISLGILQCKQVRTKYQILRVLNPPTDRQNDLQTNDGPPKILLLSQCLLVGLPSAPNIQCKRSFKIVISLLCMCVLPIAQPPVFLPFKKIGETSVVVAAFT